MCSTTGIFSPPAALQVPGPQYKPLAAAQARAEGALLQRRAEAAEAEAAAQRAAARRDLRRAAREAADAGEEAARLREAVRDLRVRCREAALDAEAARGRRSGAFAPPLRCARALQPVALQPRPAGCWKQGRAAWRGAARTWQALCQAPTEAGAARGPRGGADALPLLCTAYRF